MRDDADTVPVATPAQQDELADRLRAQAAIHLDSRGRRRTGELLLDAADALTAANARVETLEAAAEALEQRTYGWIVGDPEGVYADFDECLSNFDYDPDDGAIIEWEVATVLRTERYRIVHERDEEGDIIRTKAELVTDAATGPIGGVA